jgi:hypothetical protein
MPSGEHTTVYTWLTNPESSFTHQNVPSRFKYLSYLKEIVELRLVSIGTFFITSGSRFAGVRLPVVHCEYFVMCPCIIGITHLEYHFLCRLLTGCTNIKCFWSSDLSSLSEGFLNEPLLWVSWRTARMEMWRQRWVVILMYADGFEPPVTEGWQSFGLIHKCTNNINCLFYNYTKYINTEWTKLRDFGCSSKW